jgi:hypothetical protein
MGKRKSEGRVELRRGRPVYLTGIRPHVCTDLGPEQFGATETAERIGKCLKNMVGTRRLELLTSTVSTNVGAAIRARESPLSLVPDLCFLPTDPPVNLLVKSTFSE